jgi:drug/metabolite transporter (DMT)-like permease
VFTAACLRFALAALSTSLWAWSTGKDFRLKQGQFKHVFILTLIFVFQIGLYNVGLKFTHASRGTLLSNLQPFFVLILAHFFIPGDRITFKKILGIVFGFIGVSFILFQKEGVTAELRTGDLLTLISVTLWAINAVYTKKILSGFTPFHLVFYPGILSVPFFFIGALIWDTPMVTAINTDVVISILYQGIVTASFGFVVWMELLNKYGAVAMHSYVFILPVAGVFFGGVVLGEPVMSGHIMMSLFFIVLGIAVVHSRKTNKGHRISL